MVCKKKRKRLSFQRPIKAPRVDAEEMRYIPQQSRGKRSDMHKAVDRSRPPSGLLLALEVRAIWELQAFLVFCLANQFK